MKHLLSLYLRCLNVIPELLIMFLSKTVINSTSCISEFYRPPFAEFIFFRGCWCSEFSSYFRIRFQGSYLLILTSITALRCVTWSLHDFYWNNFRFQFSTSFSKSSKPLSNLSLSLHTTLKDWKSKKRCLTELNLTHITYISKLLKPFPDEQHAKIAGKKKGWRDRNPFFFGLVGRQDLTWTSCSQTARTSCATRMIYKLFIQFNRVRKLSFSAKRALARWLKRFFSCDVNCATVFLNSGT